MHSECNPKLNVHRKLNTSNEIIEIVKRELFRSKIKIVLSTDKIIQVIDDVIISVLY